MNILIGEKIKEIVNIVNINAKYQKVLILYDNTTSSLFINEIFHNLKDLCIFNKMELNNIDKNELFNGYKILIFIGSSHSLLNCNFNRDDFINIYCLSDENLLPCFINNNKILAKNSFIILSKTILDLNMISSVYFNNFVNYFENIINGIPYLFNMESFNEFSLFKITETLNSFNYDYKFFDINILKDSDIEYNNIGLLHLIITDALIVFLESIKNNQCNLVDVYKIAKNNSALLDKFYANFFNESVYNSIILNFSKLMRIAQKTKENIIQNLNLNYNINLSNIDNLIYKIKTYLKNCNNYLNYLYLFNIFGI